MVAWSSTATTPPQAKHCILVIYFTPWTVGQWTVQAHMLDDLSTENTLHEIIPCESDKV